MKIPEPYASFIERCSGLNLLVAGDLMVDQYLWGSVERVSPEAPVPVVDIDREERRPGGAANVALNLAAMGAKVTLTGVTGDDDSGRALREMLPETQFDTRFICADPGRRTTTKTRIIGNNQHVIRLDREDRHPFTGPMSEQLAFDIAASIRDFDGIIFEDYDKGFLHATFVQTLIEAARRAGIPTIVDPKFNDFFSYHNCTVFKPNLKELNEGLNLRISNRNLDEIRSAIGQLREKMPHDFTLVTLSENGMFGLGPSGEDFHLPAHLRKIRDVSGAGDTVVALLGLGLAGGLDFQSAAHLANLGGGLVCEDVGVVPVNRQSLIEQLAK